MTHSILLVEDEPTAQLLTARQLTRAGFEISPWEAPRSGPPSEYELSRASAATDY
jgi:CheY-like chemotaxis protein